MSNTAPIGPQPPLPPAIAPAEQKQLTTWEKIAGFFNRIFHPERTHFTAEMKAKITQVKTGPHDKAPDPIAAENQKLKDAVLLYLSKKLTSTKKEQDEEITRYYNVLYKMVQQISQKQGEYERVRKEQLPITMAELLSGREGTTEENELFIALCPFLTQGKLQLDSNYPPDQLIINAYHGRWWSLLLAPPPITIDQLRRHFPDEKLLLEYLTNKFDRLLEKDPDIVKMFMETMPTPPVSKNLSPDEQRSSLEKLVAVLVPKVIDAFLVKVKEEGEWSSLFDGGASLLKTHLESLEQANHEAEEIRKVIDELKAILTTKDAPKLEGAATDLVVSIWGAEEELLTKTPEESNEDFLARKTKFLDSSDAKKREDYYIKECRYKAMGKIEGETVTEAALAVTDHLNRVRKIIRHEKNREQLAAVDRQAIAELRTLLLKEDARPSREMQEVARKIWGNIDSKYLQSDDANQKVEEFITQAPGHFQKVKPSTDITSTVYLTTTFSPKKGAVSPGSSSARPMSPSSPRVTSPFGSRLYDQWHWKLQPNEIEPLTDDEIKKLDALCLKAWGMGFDAMVQLPSIDREYAFREVAYKNYVKDKKAGQIANLAKIHIEKMLKGPLLDDLIKALKTSGELGPLQSLLDNKEVVANIRKILPPVAATGAKWALKNGVADMLEAPQLKRVVDDILPESIVTIHAVLLKTLLQRRLPDLATALLDHAKKEALFEQVGGQYKDLIKKELQEEPPFNVDTILNTVFAAMQKDLGEVIAEINGNEALSEKEKRNVLLEAMKFYLQAMPGENQSVYSDLVSLAAFDIAELPSFKSTIDNFGLGKLLSQVITSNLYPYRTEPREFHRIFTKQLGSMATTEPATTVPFEIRIPYAVRPAGRSALMPERSALLKALAKENNKIGTELDVLPISDQQQSLVIKFKANKKWLEENDTKTVEQILTDLGLESHTAGLVRDSFQMSLREKMAADKVQKLVPAIILVAKVNLGIGVATSIFDRIKAFFANHLFNKFVSQTVLVTGINKLMRKTLFQGLVYPQDPLHSQRLPETKALSKASVKLIRSGKLPTTHQSFAKDEVQTSTSTRTSDVLADPFPNIKETAIKRFASLLTDGIRTVVPVLLNAKAWLFQSALLATGQASHTEIETLIKGILKKADFTPPVQGSTELSANYQKRVEDFEKHVYGILNALVYDNKARDKAIEVMEKKGIYSGEVKDAFDAFCDDSIEEFLILSPETQQQLYQALQEAAVEKLLESTAIKSLEVKLGRRLAHNLVLRTGAATEVKVGPLQGVDWTEKLLYPLLDQLETEEGFLKARQQMRALSEARGVVHVKAFGMAALRSAELAVDPITAYLKENKQGLERFLRPLLLSFLPEGFTIDEDDFEEWMEDSLIAVTASPRFMGLLMKEVERATPPFYPLLDYLETQDEFKKIRAEGDVKKIDEYFTAHCKDPKLEPLLRAALTSFQSPADEIIDFRTPIEELYTKYKHKIFEPQFLFARNFVGLNRDGKFRDLLRPLLARLHGATTQRDLTTEQLYTEILKKEKEENKELLTESVFRTIARNDAIFAQQLRDLIFEFFLSAKEQQENINLSGLELLNKYKEKLFEPNLHVSLLLGDAVRSAPVLTEKIADILLPTLVEDVLTRLQELDRKPVTLADGTQVPKRIIKGTIDRAAERVGHHFAGLLAVEGRTDALTVFKKDDKAAHPFLKERGVSTNDGSYRNEVKAFALQFVKQIRSTFLTDAEKRKLITLLWERKDELIPLLGLDAELMHGILSDKVDFVEFGFTLLEGFMETAQDSIADIVTEKLLEMAAPQKFQRMILSALPAVTSALKPTVLSKLFLQQAAKDDAMAKRLWNYTQMRVGDITKDIIAVSHLIHDVEFTNEQILEVQRSLRQTLSQPISEASEDVNFEDLTPEEIKKKLEELKLKKFKSQLTATRVSAEDFADQLLAKGFSGGMRSSDRLKVGMKRAPSNEEPRDENEKYFEDEALKERSAMRVAGKIAPGKIISDEDFDAACESVFEKLSDKNATKTKILKELREKKLKPPIFVSLIENLSAKGLKVAFSKNALITASFHAFANTIAPPQATNDMIIEQLTPIVYNDNPVDSLSRLLQPALTDIFNRDFFAKKDGDQSAPTEDDFKQATKELAKLIAILAPRIVTYIVDLQSTIATVLFDLTKQGWENENMIFHVISALSEQLEPSKT